MQMQLQQIFLWQNEDATKWDHLAELLKFALALIDTLNRINSQSFNNFMLRIGKGLQCPLFQLLCRGDNYFSFLLLQIMLFCRSTKRTVEAILRLLPLLLPVLLNLINSVHDTLRKEAFWTCLDQIENFFVPLPLTQISQQFAGFS